MWNCGRCASRNDWLRIRCVACGGKAPSLPQTKRVVRGLSETIAARHGALEPLHGQQALAHQSVAFEVPADAFLVSELLEVPYRLYRSKTVHLGRGPDNHIVLPIQQVSRYHASIEGSPRGFDLVDRGSMNGTLANGKPAARHRLEENDRIRIGAVELVFTVSLVSGGDGRDPGETAHELTASSSFAGTLDHVGLPEVWQILELGQKTGRLQVQRGEERGALWFVAGRPTHAELGERRGDDAALQLLLAGGGTFHFYPGPPREEAPTILRSATSLMLEAARVLDEQGETSQAA